MRRRVLFMISSMRGGGSEQQTLLLLKHLDRSKFELHLFLQDREGDLISQIPEDVTIHAFDAGLAGGIYFPGRVLREQIRQVAEIIQREAIDVVYDRTFHMTLIAGPACKPSNTPRVSTIVSPPDQALPMVESRFVWLKRRQLATAYRQSRTVVAVSQVAADSAQSYYGLSKRVVVIHSGVDCESIVAAAKQSSVDHGDRLTLVCVGRMTEEKGHRDLIAAIELLPKEVSPIRIVMIGDGPLRAELQQHANELCGPHDVFFLGNVANPAPYVAMADSLVLPSRFEGLPNVVLEAMALGIPVIATRAGGTIELEREQPTISWCDPNDPESLADAIGEFANDPAAAKVRVANATDLIAKHHDVKNVTGRIEQLLLDGTT